MDTITPGMVPKEILDKFQEKYFRKYGILLSDEENTKMAIDFLNMMRILIYPQRKPKI